MKKARAFVKALKGHVGGRRLNTKVEDVRRGDWSVPADPLLKLAGNVEVGSVDFLASKQLLCIGMSYERV